jgi:hypothetical protein
MNTITGSVDESDAVGGCHTLRYRQSSLPPMRVFCFVVELYRNCGQIAEVSAACRGAVHAGKGVGGCQRPALLLFVVGTAYGMPRKTFTVTESPFTTVLSVVPQSGPAGGAAAGVQLAVSAFTRARCAAPPPWKTAEATQARRAAVRRPAPGRADLDMRILSLEASREIIDRTGIETGGSRGRP